MFDRLWWIAISLTAAACVVGAPDEELDQLALDDTREAGTESVATENDCSGKQPGEVLGCGWGKTPDDLNRSGVIVCVLEERYDPTGWLLPPLLVPRLSLCGSFEQCEDFGDPKRAYCYGAPCNLDRGADDGPKQVEQPRCDPDTGDYFHCTRRAVGETARWERVSCRSNPDQPRHCDPNGMSHIEDSVCPATGACSEPAVCESDRTLISCVPPQGLLTRQTCQFGERCVGSSIDGAPRCAPIERGNACPEGLAPTCEDDATKMVCQDGNWVRFFCPRGTRCSVDRHGYGECRDWATVFPPP